MPAIAIRIGNGFDIHRLEEGLPLILGGVKLENSKGSVGHSDGDVVTHAVIDALLGAAALGDIGMHFPPTDNAIKGIDSMKMLEKTMSMLEDSGFIVSNIDVTVVCESPKLSPHYLPMRQRLAEVVGLNESQVSVKAKTAEKLGPIGEGNAIAAYAVALIAEED